MEKLQELLDSVAADLHPDTLYKAKIFLVDSVHPML